VLAVRTAAALDVKVLRAIGGLPPHIVTTFEEPVGFQQLSDGTYFVFDRRGHTVYSVDAARTMVRTVTQIGQEEGRVIQPGGFDVAPDGTFVVTDAPRAQDRIQIFGPAGLRLFGFFLPGRSTWTVTLGSLVLNGIGSLQYTGESLLISLPDTGSLITEYSRAGYAFRSIGRLRDTGYEQDRDLHLAMNAGLPLVDPTGGYFYVFFAGRPMFRKYDAKGTLVYERHIEGRELDDYLAAQPTRWPTRRVQDREVPFVAPTIRTAAVDARGRLWISLTVPYTYVYDVQGDKVHTVQFRAAGIISPFSLFFSPGGRLLVTPGCYEFDPRSL
jgi:hypothetical protein